MIGISHSLSATGVIFDDDLSPAQQRNLEDLTNLKILDRTALILDIFAQRAKTREGKYQVELAQLNYLLPRLTGHGVMLSRLGGGIGTRGPGETKLEVDRRTIRDRIFTLENRISQIRKQRSTQRKKRIRSHIHTAAIIGYTNTGKSTLLNALTDAEIYVADKLFATLDPTTRKIILPNKEEIVLSDTVGFINKLPHTLIAAFRATLEETHFADLLLIVVDASSPHYEQQLDATFTIIKELGIEHKPYLIVWNKIDLLEESGEIDFLLRFKTPSVAISAKDKIGFDKMMFEIQKVISTRNHAAHFKIPYDHYNLLAHLHSHAKVTKCTYKDEGIFIEAYVPTEYLDSLKEYLVRGKKTKKTE